MKRLMISFYCIPVLLFSFFACAITPDNITSAIRRNVQNTAPHPPASIAENTPYLMVMNNKNQVIIPAGKILIMPAGDALNTITHVVNYTGISEARSMIKTGNTFTLQ
ncbi:TPA: hypothetical protein G8M64_002181 [Salmonella enterica]|nr:hypothetical protein [Salmonella enterica]